MTTQTPPAAPTTPATAAARLLSPATALTVPNTAPRYGWLAWTGIAVAVLAVAIVWVLFLSPQSNVGFKDTAALLSILTAGAVGIERIIEAFWTLIGMISKFGPWWPLGEVGQAVNNAVSNLSKSIAPFFEQADNTIARIKVEAQWTDQQFENAKEEIKYFRDQINAFEALAPGNGRAQLIVAAASQGIEYLAQKYPELKEAADVANSLVQDLSTFVASFQDNPGRRLLSLFFGALLGLTAAGVLGLNVVLATVSVGPTWLLDRGGIVLTGLVMGLGSNPTHEVIRLLQEYKKGQKITNDNAAMSGSANGAG